MTDGRVVAAAGDRLRSVEEASLLQRRLYRALRETMRAMAGRIVTVGDWPAKKMLARHIWLDAQHADLVRTRVLELRYPRIDVDLDCDVSLLQVLERLPRIDTDAEFLAGIYTAVKPMILSAIDDYLDGSDPLGDAPSYRNFRVIREELLDELKEFEDVWNQLPAGEREASHRWQHWVQEALLSAGGLCAADSAAPISGNAEFSDRLPYEIPLLPKRDPSWLSAVTQVPPRPPRTPEEQQVWVAIDHVNEIWASELPAALIWHYPGLPWKLYLEAARWSYDEMRHAMLGERRLRAWGFEPGVDVPVVPDHWVGVAQQRGLEAMIFLVHGLEQGGPRWKAQLKAQLWNMGDPVSSQDCDFDWADEAGHIRYGLEWIQAVFPAMTKSEIVERTQLEVSLWKQWIADRHASGDHGYDKFLPGIEEKCASMPKLVGVEYFEPLGSSAATASYGISA